MLTEVNNINEKRQYLADHLPSGVGILSKNMPHSVDYRLLLATAVELVKSDKYFNDLLESFFLQNDKLVAEWEEFVGIPSECIAIAQTLQDRIALILFKLRARAVFTYNDYIRIAELIGYKILNVSYSGDSEFRFPLKFPIKFSPPPYSVIFEIEGEFLGNAPRFPLKFPITFRTGSNFDLLICIFNKLKPLHKNFIYNFTAPVDQTFALVGADGNIIVGDDGQEITGKLN